MFEDLLDKQEVYDVMTALRGPDVESKFARKVKLLFTVRLRHWAGVKNTGLTGASPVIKEFESVLKMAKEIQRPSWWFHWFCHMRDALYAIKKMKPEIEDEARLLIDMLHEISGTLSFSM